MDLPGLPGEQLVELSDELSALAGLDAAPALADRLRQARNQVPQIGLAGAPATRLISALNDRLTARIVLLVAARHHLPPTEWCWLAMGSEGRLEQTLVSDQDNGLVFVATDEIEAAAMRGLFLPFAQEVNARLAECGFALCSGEIMAGNPAWCLSLDEWRSRFIDWVRCPDPTALLNATIFFDLRPLYGDFRLGDSLRELLLGLTVDTPAFLHLMAANAVQVTPPLNFLGEVALDDEASVDLKKFGSRLFVDAARIFALASGTRAVNSFDRLQAAGPVIGLQPAEIAAAQAALSHLLRLRLEHQARALTQASGEGADEGLKPASLHEIDRVLLRESLRQARRLQQRLKLNYSL